MARSTSPTPGTIAYGDVPAEVTMDLTFDGFGNLWVTTTASVRGVTAGADGLVTGDDEALTVYGAKRVAYPETVTTCLSGVVLRPGDASAYILDSCLGLMIRLDRTQEPGYTLPRP